MVRLLAFLIVLALAAYGLQWLAENPGDIALTWRGVEYDVSLMFGLGVVLALASVKFGQRLGPLGASLAVVVQGAALLVAHAQFVSEFRV